LSNLRYLGSQPLCKRKTHKGKITLIIDYLFYYYGDALLKVPGG